MSRHSNLKKFTTVNRPRKGVYILPNLLTTAGLFAGFFAIVQATVGNYSSAAIAIFVVMIMDALDGRVARITSTASDFGKEYDSLADMIAFGLAPALVVYEWGLKDTGRIGWLVAFIFVAATALRLARFNTLQARDKRYFQGLPSPMAASVVAAGIWIVDSVDVSTNLATNVGIILMVVLALAMVSSMPYRSFKDVDVRDRIPFAGLFVVVFLFALVSFDPPRVLFLISSVYFLSGPTIWFIRRIRRVRRIWGIRNRRGSQRDSTISLEEKGKTRRA